MNEINMSNKNNVANVKASIPLATGIKMPLLATTATSNGNIAPFLPTFLLSKLLQSNPMPTGTSLNQISSAKHVVSEMTQVENNNSKLIELKNTVFTKNGSSLNINHTILPTATKSAPNSVTTMPLETKTPNGTVVPVPMVTKSGSVIELAQNQPSASSHNVVEAKMNSAELVIASNCSRGNSKPRQRSNNTNNQSKAKQNSNATIQPNATPVIGQSMKIV